MLQSTEEQTKIKSLIRKLIRQVEDDLERVDNNGLLSCLAGHLLFLYRAANVEQSWVDEVVFNRALEKLQEQLGEQTPELSTGLAGQAWLLEYLNQANEADYDPALLEEVDQFFVKALDSHPWHGEIEMVLGLAGYSPYAARRARKTNQSELLERLLAGFESSAIHLANGHIAWSQPPNSVYRLDTDNLDSHEFNLGLAHGVPGIIAALLPVLQDQVLYSRAKHLITSSCDWLLAQQGNDSECAACFATQVGGKQNSRLGWCYGDLTIALTLARAGHALDMPSYVDKALEIALYNVDRDANSGVINDAGLCHGFFGLVTIYQQLNQVMPHPKLAAAALKWLNYGLDKYQCDGLTALYSFNGREQAYQPDYSFLMGYSGIGLALVSALDGDLDWTDSLLMS